MQNHFSFSGPLGHRPAPPVTMQAASQRHIDDACDKSFTAFLPHSSTRSFTAEAREYCDAKKRHAGQLETVLYGSIWAQLANNEREALAHLYYESPHFVQAHTALHASMHRYIHARQQGRMQAAKKHLGDALWEVLHCCPFPAKNLLERDKARHRRKAQADMLNSLRLNTKTLPTPDAITTPLRARYQRMPLEALLPNLAFPLEETARRIARDIQRINAETEQQLQALRPSNQKSLISDSENQQDAEDAFALLTEDIAAGIYTRIDAEITKQAALGRSEEAIVTHINQTVTHYEDTVIPQKMSLLATHFNGKLSEIRAREAGHTHYIWRSQDDPKVRPDHAANNHHVFAWDAPPATGHPGHDYNCRCYAEPFTPISPNGIDDPPIESVPIEALIPSGALFRTLLRNRKTIIEATKRLFKDPIAQRPKGVPKEWVKEKNKDARGYIYRDPKVKDGGTYVKISKGNPASTNPGQRVDNVRIQKTGQSFDKHGNKVPRKSKESHIPLDEFERYDPEKFK